MKKLFIFITIFALIALCVTDAISQNATRTSIKGSNGWYYNVLTATNSGVAGGTLFDNAVTTAETSMTYHPGGWSLVSLKYSVADTCRDTIYVDLSVDDEASWSVIATKAINCTDYLVPTVYEEVLRDGDTDILDTVVGSIRVRNNRATAGNGTAGSRPTITVKLNWKP